MRVPRPERRAALLSALLATLALSVAPAQADVGGEILTRCFEGQSLAGFTQAQYRQALKELSATAEEYSPCALEIRQAQTAAASSHGGAGSSGAGSASTAPAGAIAATPSEQQSLDRAARSGSGPVGLGNGEIVHPGVVHADIASALSTLPTPLLAVLALMLAGLLLLGATVLRRRIRGRAD